MLRRFVTAGIDAGIEVDIEAGIEAATICGIIFSNKPHTTGGSVIANRHIGHDLLLRNHSSMHLKQNI